MKKILPLVCLPLLSLFWLAACDESPPTGPEATVSALQAANVGPKGRPAWVRAYAHVAIVPGEERLGWQVLHGYNVDRVVTTSDPPGESCVVLDPSLGWSWEQPVAVVVSSGPWQTAGSDAWDDDGSGAGVSCIHVWTGHVDNPSVPAQSYSIVVF